MWLLFSLSTPSSDDSEIHSGICGASGPDPALDIVVRFSEACIVFSPLGIKREKDGEAQKRIAASAKAS